MERRKPWRTIPNRLTAAAMLVSLLVTLPASTASGEQPNFPIDERAEAKWLAELGDGFSITRSEHFTVASDLEAGRLDETSVLDLMEETLARVAHFCDANGLSTRRLERRLEAVFKVSSGGGHGARRLGPPRPPGALGVYDSVSKRSFFDGRRRSAGDVGPGSFATLRAERLTLRHETAHQVMDHFCPTLAGRMPDWLSEGLACSFEVDVSRGIRGYRAYHDLRADDFLSWSRDTLLERVITEPAPFAVQPEIPAGDPRERAGELSAWYAASWSLVSYLQNVRGGAFRRYLHRLGTLPDNATRAKQVALFAQAFGPVNRTLSVAVTAFLERSRDSRAVPDAK